MRISIIAVGTRMPAWVNDGVAAYRERLPRHINVEIIEIPPGNRSGQASIQAALDKEAEQLLKRSAGADRTIALDEHGKTRTSSELAADMQAWLNHAPHVALLIGGPLAFAAVSLAYVRAMRVKLALPKRARVLGGGHSSVSGPSTVNDWTAIPLPR